MTKGADAKQVGQMLHQQRTRLLAHHSSSNFLRLTWLISASATLLLTLYLRSPQQFLEPQLFGEDGNIFFNQSREVGLSSLFIEYAGSIHVLLRIASLVAIADPINVPWYFTFARLFLVSLTIVSIMLAIPPDQPLKRFFSIVLVGMVPTWGEPYGSLVNTQWLIAPGLFLSLYWSPSSHKLPRLILCLLLSFTGPYSIIILPAAGLTLLLQRDFVRRWEIYSGLAVGATVQIFVLLGSPRHSESASAVYAAALALPTIIARALLLYEHLLLGVMVFAALVTCIVLNFICSTSHKRVMFATTLTSVLCLLGAGAIAVAREIPPAQMSPIGVGGRYFYVPMYLIIFYYIYISDAIKSAWLRVSYMAIPFLLTSTEFKKFHLDQYNWESFVLLAEAVPTVVAPINFSAARYPWFSATLRVAQKPGHLLTNLGSEKDGITFRGLKNDGSGAYAQDPGERYPAILVDAAAHCNDFEHIGIILEQKNSKGFWSQIRLLNGTGDPQALRRFTREGLVSLEFAFPRHSDLSLIEYIASDWKAGIIENIRIGCLRKKVTAP